MDAGMIYPKRTKWENRDEIPPPHPWRTRCDNNSWGLKEHMGIAIVLAIAFATLAALWSHKSWFMLVVALVVVLLLWYPVTSLLLVNLFVTPQIRTPCIHIDPEVYFPEHAQLLTLENLDAMQEEVRTLTVENIPYADKAIKLVNNNYIASDRGWRVFNIKTAGNISEKGAKQMPRTSEIIGQMDSVHNAVISILEPKHCIPIHTGYSKAYIRGHLGLDVPEPDKTVLHVNGNAYHWKNRELMLWDDTFPHEVFNAGAKPRAILYIDIIRTVPDNPGLQNFIQGFLASLSENPLVKAISKRDENVH